MICEAIYHASGVRMAGVEAVWPEEAVVFSYFFMMLWSSVSVFVAVVLYYLQQHLEESKQLLVYLTIPSFLHAVMLICLSFTPYTEIFSLPSLHVWVPFYEFVIRTEAALLLTYVIYILYGKTRKFL